MVSILHVHPPTTTHPVRFSLLHMPNYFVLLLLLCGDQCKWWSCTWRHCLPSTLTYCLLLPHISLCTLPVDTPSIYFFLAVTDQVSHPCQTKMTVTVLYVYLNIHILYSILSDKTFCTDRQTDRQADRQTDRQQAFTQTNILSFTSQTQI